jgi:hypothetical protein
MAGAVGVPVFAIGVGGITKGLRTAGDESGGIRKG